MILKNILRKFQGLFILGNNRQVSNILLLSAVMFLPSNAMALQQNIQIEWQFQSSSEVAEFRLYQDYYNLVCSTDEPNVGSMECTVDFVECKSEFTLTAYYQNGSESPHSPTYTFDACQNEKDQKIQKLLPMIYTLLLKSDK